MDNRKRKFENATPPSYIVDLLSAEVSKEAPGFGSVKKLLTMLHWTRGVFKLHGDETNIFIPPWSFHKLPDRGHNWKKGLRAQANDYLATLKEGTDYYAFSNIGGQPYDEGKKSFMQFIRDNLETQRDYCEDLDQGSNDSPYANAPSLPTSPKSPAEREDAPEGSAQESDESEDEDEIKITDLPIAHDHAPVTYKNRLTSLLDDKLRWSFFAYLSRQNGVTSVKDLFSKAASVDIPEGSMIAETFAPEDECYVLLKPIALALEERSRGQSEEVVVAERLHVTRREGMILHNYLEIQLLNYLREGGGGK